MLLHDDSLRNYLLVGTEDYEELPIACPSSLRELDVHVATHDSPRYVRKLHCEVGRVDHDEINTLLMRGCRLIRPVLAREVGDQEREQEGQDGGNVYVLIPPHQRHIRCESVQLSSRRHWINLSFRLRSNLGDKFAQVVQTYSEDESLQCLDHPEGHPHEESANDETCDGPGSDRGVG